MTAMEQYRVKGLTCANCTRELEEEIQKLEHGHNAILSYASGKLSVDAKVALPHLEKILSKEGAYLEKTSETHPTSRPGNLSGHHEPSHNHDQPHSHSEHDHPHPSGHRLNQFILIIGAIVYVTAMLLQSHMPEWVPICMYLFVMAITGYTTFLKGIKNLLRLKFNIDTLMTIALIGAIGIREWREATLVALLFGLNELLEGYGMEKARQSVESLFRVAPKEAIWLQNNVETVVPIASLQIGDTVIVRAGDQIPSDGTVVEGKSSVNEAAITGESLPVDKSRGELVFGGSINNEGVLKIRIEKAYQDSSLAKILHLVEEAQETKTPTELLINRFANYYTPIIMIVAGLVLLIPPLFLGGSWKISLYQGLAVLIVGCPCALILSSPIAIVSGISRNAKNGILIKGGVYLEQLGQIRTLVFDKTGTLTKGKPHVVQDIIYDDRLYLVSAAMEKASSHPLAKAIMSRVHEKGVEGDQAEEITAVAGQGIKAKYLNETFWLGNEKNIPPLLITKQIQADIEELKNQGHTLVLVADEQHILGMFGIADEIRRESKAVIAALYDAGIRRTIMLTGDHEQTASKVATEVGVTSFFSNLLPEDKVEKIKQLIEQGPVAMVGDGINDAPALATATLGIAMGKGSDSAIETADIVLMQDHLEKLPEAIAIAKRVNRIIRLNIGIALGLKLIALLLTIPGLLTLWIAILSDMGATILVTLISLTILIQIPQKKKTLAPLR
jgi:Cd2+/Zn2+-exporting ATPase